MLRYEYINKEWIVSPRARLVCRTASVLSLALYPVLVAILLNEPIRFLKPLLFIGVLGMALNGLGMEYFLFRFDDSHALKQVFWFCVMVFAPLGPALYCFLGTHDRKCSKAVVLTLAERRDRFGRILAQVSSAAAGLRHGGTAEAAVAT